MAERTQQWPLRGRLTALCFTQREVSSPWWSHLLAGNIRGMKTSLISCVSQAGYIPAAEVLWGQWDERHRSCCWYYHILISLSPKQHCFSNCTIDTEDTFSVSVCENKVVNVGQSWFPLLYRLNWCKRIQINYPEQATAFLSESRRGKYDFIVLQSNSA